MFLILHYMYIFVYMVLAILFIVLVYDLRLKKYAVCMKKVYWKIPQSTNCLVFIFITKGGNPPSDSAGLTVFETLKNIDFQGGNSHF